MIKILLNLKEFCLEFGLFFFRLIQRFVDERYDYRAAGLVYTSLLAIIPVGILCITIISLLNLPEEIGKQIQAVIQRNFMAESNDKIFNFLQKYWLSARKFSWINFIFLLVIGISSIKNIEQTFNDIWRIKKKRSLIKSAIIYSMIFIFGPLLIGIGILISVSIFSYPFIAEFIDIPFFKENILSLTPYIFTFLGFFTINKFLPNTHVHIENAAWGALFATIAVEVSKWGFGKYILYSTTYTYLYGVLAIFPLFLVWLYIFWIIVLLSAMISYSANNNFQP